MIYILKIPVKNKTFSKLNKDGTRPKVASAKFAADYFLEFEIKENKMNITGYTLKIKSETEVNVHNQNNWSKKVIKKRKEIFPSIKNLFFKDKNIKKKSEFKKNIDVNKIKISAFYKITLNDVYKYFKGSNPTGAETSKLAQEILLDLPDINELNNKPFINLFKAFTKEKNIYYKNLDIRYTINIKEFINLLNDDEKFVFDYYYNSVTNDFYINEWKEFLRNYNANPKIYNSKLKPLLVQEYGPDDHLYGQYSTPKVVEGCHIKPKSHIDKQNLTQKEKEKEKDNIYNGLLLPAHIHRLFDGGYLTFENNGKPKFEKQNKKGVKEFAIHKSEYEILELEKYQLKKELLVPERLEYLKYHRNNVYQKGI